jgi:hypothetical protein
MYAYSTIIKSKDYPLSCYVCQLSPPKEPEAAGMGNSVSVTLNTNLSQFCFGPNLFILLEKVLEHLFAVQICSYYLKKC